MNRLPAIMAMAICILAAPSLAQTRYRLLVAYTPAGQALAGDIVGQVRLAVAETNTAYANSQVDIQVDLVGLFLTNYTETGGTGETDLARLRTPNDGHMDEVIGYRDRTSADVVILVTGDSYAYWGLASGIAVPEAAAYAWVVGLPGLVLTGYYTLAHEVGHMYGGRHPDDNGTTPAAYGHGHCATTFRTIMSGYGHCAGDPTRIQYFSDPLGSFGTPPVPRGTAARADMRRLLNERAGIVAGFRNIPATQSLAPLPLRNREFAELVATSSLITTGTWNLPAGAELALRSNGTITLDNGFTAAEGSTLSVVAGVTPLGKASADDAPQAFEEKSPPVAGHGSPSPAILLVSGVEPCFRVTGGQGRFRFRVFDLAGKAVLDRRWESPNPGAVMRLPVPSQVRGSLLVAIIENEGQSVRKLLATSK